MIFRISGSVSTKLPMFLDKNMWLQKIDSTSIFIGDIYPWTLFCQHIWGWFWWRVGFIVVDSTMAVFHNHVGRLLLQPVIACTLWSVHVVSYFAFFMLFFQVWPLTQFFLSPFCKKVIDLPGGQINEPSSGKHYSLPFLPATPSSPSRALLPELQRNKDTVRRVVSS